MSEEDRARWNERFQQGAYNQRTHPSALLVQHEHLLRELTALAAATTNRVTNTIALDIACGAGRNTHYLCQHGFAVTAIDISTVALQRLLADSPQRDNIQIIEHDLDDGLPDLADLYAVIVVMRFLKLELLPEIQTLLAPQGLLVCEVLLQKQALQSAGPGGSRFRAEKGALKAAAAGMAILHYFEGEVLDPDGKPANVAQIIARKTV